MLWILEQIDTLEPEAVLSLLPTISEARRVRVQSMTHVPTRVRSVLAELLLRHALREEFGLTDPPRIETGEKGKPFFPDRPDLQFSLSHCQTAVACALAPALVGVDVQEVRPLCRAARPLAAASPSLPLEGKVAAPEARTDEVVPRRDGTLPSASPSLPPEGKVAAPEALTDEVALQARKTLPLYRILSESERAWVAAGETSFERDRRFTAVWTCKEAWGKALGVGFLYDLRSTCFIPNKEIWQQHGFCFTHLSNTDYELNLCSHEPLPRKSVTFKEIVNEVTL